MHVFMYVCMYVCMYLCMYVCIYVSMYVRMYLCMYLCMLIFCFQGGSKSFDDQAEESKRKDRSQLQNSKVNQIGYGDFLRFSHEFGMGQR